VIERVESVSKRRGKEETTGIYATETYITKK